MKRTCPALAAAACVCLLAGPEIGAQTDPGDVFTLEMPAIGVKLKGNATAVLPPGNPAHFQIHIGLQPAQIGYGNIYVRINTESANVIMTTSAATSGVNCDFDLLRRQGFRLRPGRNSIEIAVQDLRGRLRYASFLLEMSAQTAAVRAAAPIAVASGERFALVLGISRYRAAAAGVRNLAFADRDASALRDFLVSPAGGYLADHVELLLNEDATLERMRAALDGIASRASADDMVMVYVSGHGVADPDDQRKSYLLAHDSRPGELSETALPFGEVEDFFGRRLKTKAVVAMFDVARSNALARSAGAGNTLVHQYLSRYAGGGSRAVLAAADVGESSWESDAPDAKSSVFARFLLEGLRGDADANRDGTVTFGELTGYVRGQVRKATGGLQSPTGTVGDGDALALAGLRARPARP